MSVMEEGEMTEPMTDNGESTTQGGDPRTYGACQPLNKHKGLSQPEPLVTVLSIVS